MANHLISRFTRNLFFLVTYTAAIVAASSPQEHISPLDFQNERLHQAYLAIQRFKSTITCDPMNITSTWTGHDICGKSTYVGFYCSTPLADNKSLTVTSAVLDGFGLCAPKLKGFIDQLPDLALFQAASNDFGAFDLPNLAGLTYMSKLDIMDTHHAQFLGSKLELPTKDLLKLCLILKLVCVNVGGTPLVQSSLKMGAVPGATGARALLLNGNNLYGSLPANIGFSKLSYLALANNKLTGPIPPSVAHMQDSLLEVLLLNNQLSGCLPDELGMLTKTAVIDAGMNQLTGTIPSSFSCLGSVEQLNLGGNRLYGQVPDALCKLAGPAGRLSNLTLSGNYFTSVGPACSALIKDGVLDVKHNCIPGFANQRGPAECASFLSQAKTCPAASARVACPAADAKMNAAAPEGRVAKDYSSYVVYATLHE